MTFYVVSVRWVGVLPTGLVFSPASGFLQIPLAVDTLAFG
jgi:hypothetical protein